MNKEEFIKNSSNLNIEITEEMFNKFEDYYSLLYEWNQKFNLTAITEKEDVFLLHFYDSLCLLKAVNLNDYNSICDFGTGAGFPGMVLAIINSNINITLIESNNKKCNFLEEVKNKLDLKNVTIINDRMENHSIKNKEKYDLITCRAVSNIPILLEISICSLKVNGLFIPLKSNCDEELKKYSYLEKELNIKLIDKIDYILPVNNASRTIPVYKKIGSTSNKYPRSYNSILKSYKNK